jgi:hypothetical protein
MDDFAVDSVYTLGDDPQSVTPAELAGTLEFQDFWWSGQSHESYEKLLYACTSVFGRAARRLVDAAIRFFWSRQNLWSSEESWDMEYDRATRSPDFYGDNLKHKTAVQKIQKSIERFYRPLRVKTQHATIQINAAPAVAVHSTHGHGDRGAGSRDDGSGGNDGDPDPDGADNQKQQANSWLISQYLSNSHTNFSNDQLFLLAVALDGASQSGNPCPTSAQAQRAQSFILATISGLSKSKFFASKLTRSSYEEIAYLEHLFTITARQFMYKIVGGIDRSEYLDIAYGLKQAALSSRLVSLLQSSRIVTVAELEAASGAGVTEQSRVAKENRKRFARVEELERKHYQGISLTSDEHSEYAQLKSDHACASEFLYAASPQSPDGDDDSGFTIEDLPEEKQENPDDYFSAMADRITESPAVLENAFIVLLEHPDLCERLAAAIRDIPDDERAGVIEYLRNSEKGIAGQLLSAIELREHRQRVAAPLDANEKIDLYDFVQADLLDSLMSICVGETQATPVPPKNHKQLDAAARCDKSKITTTETVIDITEIAEILDNPEIADDFVEPVEMVKPVDLTSEPAQVCLFPDLLPATKVKAHLGGHRRKVDVTPAAAVQLGLFDAVAGPGFGDGVSSPLGQSPPAARARRMGVAYG